MEYELKPCPCCGYIAELKYNKHDYCYNKEVWVECKECGLRTQEIKADADYCAADKVVELWNTRENQQEV